MNNRLTQLFSKKREQLLSVYFTAGYPELGQTIQHARALEQAGVDFIEIGFPFSDPLADGPVIQQSSQQALQNGMSLHVLFEQLKELRKEVQMPVLLMGYVNPVIQYGVEKFCASCEESGIDGIIVPDLPLAEYEHLYKDLFLKHQISNIFMVTPQTSEERIHKIDALSNPFIYLLSSSSTTGRGLQIGNVSETYFSRLRDMKLKNSLMVGFGINSAKTFQEASKYTSGAFVGTSFVKALKEGRNIAEWVQEIRG